VRAERNTGLVEALAIIAILSPGARVAGAWAGAPDSRLHPASRRTSGSVARIVFVIRFIGFELIWSLSQHCD
jgi:hypothetical protein